MSHSQVNSLLEAARRGDAAASERLLPKMYDELHRLARQQMYRENAGHTLQATALVNEAYLRMLGDAQVPENRTHFLALSAQAMRRILVDHARSKHREKRGGDLLQVTLNEWESGAAVNDQHLLELDDALEKLAEFDERAANAIELMFFAGMTYEEVAQTLGIGRTAVYEDVKAGKAWLALQMGKSGMQ